MWVPTITSPHVSIMGWHVVTAWPGTGATLCEDHAGEVGSCLAALLCMSPVPVTRLPSSALSCKSQRDEGSPVNPLPISQSPSPATQHCLHPQHSTKPPQKPQRGWVICTHWDYLSFSPVTLWLEQPRSEQSETGGDKFPSLCPVLQVFQDYSNLCEHRALCFARDGPTLQLCKAK